MLVKHKMFHDMFSQLEVRGRDSLILFGRLCPTRAFELRAQPVPARQHSGSVSDNTYTITVLQMIH